MAAPPWLTPGGARGGRIVREGHRESQMGPADHSGTAEREARVSLNRVPPWIVRGHGLIGGRHLMSRLSSIEEGSSSGGGGGGTRWWSGALPALTARLEGIWSREEWGGDGAGKVCLVSVRPSD
ncbi:hypothetical protein DPEC_G00195550 [Dallia pectoralis]|uniref:Uncharacterized protein n=1 Tax=Dallia pectoralis TaxID=75939 RepID=A0ACC2G7J3_DALPE|nr:hypothetical protein DPEC_G00195550 [Dallia pectoralis]